MLRSESLSLPSTLRDHVNSRANQPSVSNFGLTRLNSRSMKRRLTAQAPATIANNFRTMRLVPARVSAVLAVPGICLFIVDERQSAASNLFTSYSCTAIEYWGKNARHEMSRDK